MKYMCNHCKREFDLPATITHRPVIINPPPTTNIGWPYAIPIPPVITSYTVEFNTPCCPYCYSTDIEEAKAELRVKEAKK